MAPKSNALFEAILGLAMGLFLGVYSHGLFMTLIFTIFFEYYVFVSGEIKGNPSETGDRILINVVYLFGWVLSKFLFVRETGFEDLISNTKLCFETFPN